MHALRRTSALVAGAVVAAGLALPARAETQPTTFSVEGIVEVVVIDRFGTGDDEHGTSEHLYTVVTDEGARIPVDLDDEAAANGRFRGEVVVDGELASALDDKNLLPRAGSTIAEDGRAGRAAAAAAEDLREPLAVTESTVVPVEAAAATTPGPHRAYVAVMRGRGSIEESDDQVKAKVNAMAAYWRAESGGVITSFVIQDFKTFDTVAAGSTASSCGMNDNPAAVWNEAGALFSRSPAQFFGVSSRNHLIVAMADECSGSGTAGVALIGNDLSSGGPMSFSMGSIGEQVGIHEMGHTFGLGHANLDRCGGGCGNGEYFDLYSPMALAVGGVAVVSPALDSAFRVRLGVGADVSRVTLGNGPATRTVQIAPRGAVAGQRGAAVVDPRTGVTYFVELRSGAERDARAFYTLGGALSGVQMTYNRGITVSTLASSGALKLVTPAAGVGAYGSGQVFTSPSGGVRVRALPSADGASFTVTLAPRPAPKRFAAKKPKISGTAKVGRTLKVRVGRWKPRPSFRYQWYANGKKITKKGTRSSFTVTSRQKGKRITVRVTGRKAGYATLAKTSAKTKKVRKR